MDALAEITPPKMIAAVDIGTNTIRCTIAESYSDGRIEILEQLARGVWFGKETFRRGGLSAQSMRVGIVILKSFRKLFTQYDVQHIRVVATASIREAPNADIFIDRIRIATGLEVEIIDPAEEVQFIVTAVQDELRNDFIAKDKNVLIINVGGGSTLLAVLRGGTVVNSQSLNLGAIRMREQLISGNELPENSASIFRHAIRELLTAAESYFSFSEVDYVLTMGSEPRFVAKKLGEPSSMGNFKRVRMNRFDSLVERCLKMDTSRLCRTFGLNFQTAETTVPAFLTYQEILHRTSVSSFQVSLSSMRHGVLRAIAREVWGFENSNYQDAVLDAARKLAEKFHVDLEHASQTEQLAVRLFDEMKAEHGLSPRYRLLLQVSAILQNCGRFVNNRSFHKHSFYLIGNSEIFGLRRAETEMTAFIARYSYRSAPKYSHTSFMSLPREARVAISKLAAILRIADALNHGNFHDPNALEFERSGDELTVILPPDDTILLKARSLETQGKMFEDIFGIRILFRT
ncbi:MAG: hypothetical protein J6A23_13890 [Thermoguttaceae bacterium]|nr:hypothetical protein [Thermoguttaceae bacterium]